jgi:hypothetical protein
MIARVFLPLVVLFSLIASLPSWSQTASTSPYLMRVEHQTRDENVCMLVLKDGRYHLERTAAGHVRVFEGALEQPTFAELDPLLDAPKLAELKQSDIPASPSGDEVDQMMLTVPRAAGWQSLTFPSSKSRKPFKSEIDPILRWLDKNKQQQNPIANAMPTRCVPPQETAAAKGLATPNASNPYIMRIVVDHYEPLGVGTALSMDKGTAGESVGGMTTTQAMDVNSFKISRTCAVVYESGRYRFEKTVRESGKLTHSDVYRETLNKAQLDELRQILDNPKLVELPNNVAPTVLGREGDLITLAVLRGKTMQSLGFTSSGPRPASARLEDAAATALSINVGLTNPVRKWVKQNLEDNKGALVKDVPTNSCIPAAQPE